MSDHRINIAGAQLSLFDKANVPGPTDGDCVTAAPAHPDPSGTTLCPATSRYEPTGPVEEGRQWQTDPRRAFEFWTLSRRPFKREFNEHSVEQYRSMFGIFLRWLEQNEIGRLVDVTTDQVDEFLETRTGRRGEAASATTRRRYLLLIYGVFARMESLDAARCNPAEPLVQLTRHQGFRRPPPVVLSQSLMTRYVEWTCARADTSWVDARDKALRLLFLASGVSVRELRALRVQDLQLPPTEPTAVRGGAGVLAVDVAEHGFIRNRTVPVAPFAHPALLQWATLLQKMAPQAQLLFPGRTYGFGVDKLDRTAVSAPECYIIVQSALNAIGYNHVRQGPQTLRNSFVARQIWFGHSVDQITKWLGLRTTETVDKIRRLVPVRADGIAPA